MKLSEKRLAYEANWEARDRLLSKLYRRISLAHRISFALVILLLLAPAPIRYAIAIPILILNFGLFLYFRYTSRKELNYLEDSFQRFVREKGDE